ncbi:MAG: ferritin-like domain-containing protein [Planctomycetota bacterium]
MTEQLHLGLLGLDRGGAVLLRETLRSLPPGTRLEVLGNAPDLTQHLRAFARAAGHGFAEHAERIAGGVIEVGSAASDRLVGAERAGAVAIDGVVDSPSPNWGLAARGALVESGVPPFGFTLASKDALWADDLARMVADAMAGQWDPAAAIPWDAPLEHGEFLEDALVRVLTYLIENETAALLVPARFAAQVHPHFREVMQLLAIQAADEARHIEVFTRRARMRRAQLGSSTVGGQASLKTLIDEPDFELASLLLSVLGEGSFVHLLGFLHRHAPDRATAEIMRLAAIDEARHVAFGVAHLERHAKLDPSVRPRLALAIERRHATLSHTAGLNEDVFDALVVLAGGGLEPAAIARGNAAVEALVSHMDAGRRQRLARLGFDPSQAEKLSALHTRNFM